MPSRSTDAAKRKRPAASAASKSTKKKVKTNSSDPMTVISQDVGDYVDIDDNNDTINAQRGDNDNEALSKQVTLLQSTVATMQSQINFLLSALGWSSVPSANTMGDGSQTSTWGVGHDSDTSPPSSQAAVDETGDAWSVVTKRPARAAKVLRDAVVAAVYNDQQQQSNRAANLVVTGLPSSSDDKQLTTDIIRKELHIEPDIVHCKRLGQQRGSKPRPLLLVLRAPAGADEIMAKAKYLRQAASVVAQSVYINRHLTSAQSKAAYDERCRRRDRKQLRQSSSTVASSSSSAPAPPIPAVSVDQMTASGLPQMPVYTSSLCPTAADFMPLTTPPGVDSLLNIPTTAVAVAPVFVPSSSGFVAAPGVPAPMAVQTLASGSDGRPT